MRTDLRNSSIYAMPNVVKSKCGIKSTNFRIWTGRACWGFGDQLHPTLVFSDFLTPYSCDYVVFWCVQITPVWFWLCFNVIFGLKNSEKGGEKMPQVASGIIFCPLVTAKSHSSISDTFSDSSDKIFTLIKCTCTNHTFLIKKFHRSMIISRLIILGFGIKLIHQKWVK